MVRYAVRHPLKFVVGVLGLFWVRASVRAAEKD